MHDRNGDMPTPATTERDDDDERPDGAHFPQEVLSDEMPSGDMAD